MSTHTIRVISTVAISIIVVCFIIILVTCRNIEPKPEPPSSQALVINELVAANRSCLEETGGFTPDLIEIHNITQQEVNLCGYGITDDSTDLFKYTFPEIYIEPDEYLVLYASSESTDSPDDGHVQVGFGLSCLGEILILSAPDSEITDIISFDEMLPDISYGRSIEDTESWLYYAVPTPGEINTSTGFETILEVSEVDSLPNIYISEVKSVSNVLSGDPDWVEITNKGDSTVDLTGYGLSDNSENPHRYKLGEVVIGPGEYIVIENGTGESDSDGQEIAISFLGEDIYLFNSDSQIVDCMHTGYQRPDISSGRADGLSPTRVYFSTITKGSENVPVSYTAYTDEPAFSLSGGYTDAGSVIELTTEEGAVIHYTLDGTKPSLSSTVYTGSIVINETTPIQAIAVAEGKLPSCINTETFLVEDEHDIPVVCITSDPDGIFSQQSGIYARGNYWRDWEREICFEFYEEDGLKGVDFRAGIKIFGQYSRKEAKKAFAIHLRGAYGLSEVTYPFFADYDVTTFSSLLLRTSGQDWDKTMLRDVFFSQSGKYTMDLDYMEYRPVALYINGEYRGLYYLREKQNESYIHNHYGVEEDDLDIIKGNRYVRAGSNEDNAALRRWVRANDMSVEENYEYLVSQVDVNEFMDYIILQTFFNNTDTGNIRIWRQQNIGRWRWMLFDMDWGMHPTTYRWNTIREFFNPAGHGYGDAFYSHMQRALLENEGWRNEFVERYVWHLQNTFAYDTLCILLDRLTEEISDEMERNIERWGRPSSMETWYGDIEHLKEMLSEKIDITKADIQEFFNLSDERMTELFGED